MDLSRKILLNEWLAKNVMRERNEQEIIMNTTYSSIVPMKFGTRNLQRVCCLNWMSLGEVRPA